MTPQETLTIFREYGHACAQAMDYRIHGRHDDAAHARDHAQALLNELRTDLFATPEPPETSADDEQEWTVERFIAECDEICQNPPPAPGGMELVECEAIPRHWPIYMPIVDGSYPAPCFMCERDEMWKQQQELLCKRDHRRWKSWRIWSRIGSRLYVLGITPCGGSSWFGSCEFCSIGEQHHLPTRFKGCRSYILGVKRQTWTCLLHGHRTSMTYYGLCSICCPCPSCGSTDQAHTGDCMEPPEPDPIIMPPTVAARITNVLKGLRQ